MMSQVMVTIPDETLLALHATPEQAESQLRMAAAVKLYELGRLSSGAAARLAGVPKTLFLTRLADYNVTTFELTEDELEWELRVAQRYF